MLQLIFRNGNGTFYMVVKSYHFNLLYKWDDAAGGKCTFQQAHNRIKGNIYKCCYTYVEILFQN